MQVTVGDAGVDVPTDTGRPPVRIRRRTEFLIVCEDIRDHPNGQLALTRLGDRIREAVSEPIPINGTHLSVAASIGVAVTAEHPLRWR